MVPKLKEPSKFVPKEYDIEQPVYEHYAETKYCPDTKDNFKLRQKQYKNYYTKTKQFFTYRYREGVIDEVEIGHRLVLDNSESEFQYTLITVEIDYEFMTTESISDQDTNTFICDMQLICIAMTEKEVNP